MNFTPKMSVVSVVRGTLTIAVVGLIAWANHVAPTPIVTTQKAIGAQEASQMNGNAAVIPAVAVTSANDLQGSYSAYYQPVTHWYSSKHWWKRNAPIVGGAGGGALIGGLAGGPAGMVIGGAVGGGGGYLVKRGIHHHHEHEYHQRYGR